MKQHHIEALICLIIGILIACLAEILSSPHPKENNPAFNQLVGTSFVLIGMFFVRSTSFLKIFFNPRTTAVLGMVSCFIVFNIIKHSPNQLAYFLLGGYLIGIIIGVIFRTMFERLPQVL